MKTKSNHFLCICISQKNSMTFSCTHYARRSLKTGYAIDPYCVKGKIHRGGSTVIALLFLYLCTRLGLVFNTMPWPIYPPGNDPVPIVYETEWALGRVWMGVENIDPNGIGSLDHPVRNELLYQVHYPCPPMYCVGIHNWGPSDTNHLTSWHNCTGMHTLHIIIVKVLEPTENWTFSLLITNMQHVLKFYDYGEKLICICIIAVCCLWIIILLHWHIGLA